MVYTLESLPYGLGRAVVFVYSFFPMQDFDIIFFSTIVSVTVMHIRVC